MSDVEVAIRHWRRELERESRLAAHEVDELEDHLRARVDLEMELNDGLAPARAFRDVRAEIGEPQELAREFAKVGRSGWSWLVPVGCGLFAVSLFLPVFGEFTIRFGYQVFWQRWPIFLPMLLTVWEAWRSEPARSRALVWLNVAAAFYLVAVPDELIRGHSSIVIGDTIRRSPFFAGYWIWTASQLLVTAGLWVGTRRWAPTRAWRVLD